MAVKTDYKTGDKVVFISEEEHKEFPNFYPEVGTVGTVVNVHGFVALVKWEQGSTSKGDCWWCNCDKIIPTKEYFKKEKEKVMRNYSTADVAEVKHGEWVHGECVSHCSECGFETYPENITPYCPNCGARMDGGDFDEMPNIKSQE